VSNLSVPPSGFLVHGIDGRDYPADLESLQQWAREGRITPEQQIYSYESGAWLPARELPALRDLFAAMPAAQNQGSSSCLTAGCAVTIALVVFMIIASLITGGRSRSRRSSPETATSSPAATSPSDLGSSVRTTAADLFTSRFASSTLAGWHIRGRAAGADCGVLLVTFDVNMEDSMISSFHYGNGIYGSILPGGVAQFYPERSFRGVVYRDADGRSWTYGSVSSVEASSISPC
jgi:hypothetical protein